MNSCTIVGATLLDYSIGLGVEGVGSVDERDMPYNLLLLGLPDLGQGNEVESLLNIQRVGMESGELNVLENEAYSDTISYFATFATLATQNYGIDVEGVGNVDKRDKAYGFIYSQGLVE